jgi:hypothetical protein
MTAYKIKTAADLKHAVQESNREPHFFARDTMKFFGDTMRNYGVRGPVEVTTATRTLQAFELYRRRPVRHGLQESAYFDAASFARVFPSK